MSLLDTFLNNDTVRKMAFGQLKGLFQEKNLEFIVMSLDADGEVMLDMYAVGESVIVAKSTPEGVESLSESQGFVSGAAKQIPAAAALKAITGGKKGGKRGKN